MITFTYEKAQQNLSAILAKSAREGTVRIKGKDGKVYVLKPAKSLRSPLDVKGVKLGITTEEIIQFIHESRKNK